MVIEREYEKYLECVERYLNDNSKEDKEIALLNHRSNEQKDAASRVLKRDQNRLAQAARTLTTRFSKEVDEIAALKIEGLALPSRVRPTSTQLRVEDLNEQLKGLYAKLEALKKEHAEIATKEAADLREKRARKRREAVTEARKEVEKQYEIDALSDATGEYCKNKNKDVNRGCAGIAAMLVVCILHLSYLLIWMIVGLAR